MRSLIDTPEHLGDQPRFGLATMEPTDRKRAAIEAALLAFPEGYRARLRAMVWRHGLDVLADCKVLLAIATTARPQLDALDLVVAMGAQR